MTWYTLEDAAAREGTRAQWEARVAARQVSAYVDGWGRQRVWIDEDAPASASFGAPFGASCGVGVAIAESPSATEVDPAPAPLPAADEPEAVLAVVADRWRGSERELERRAGLPKAFLAKAKKGQRGGPRSAASWERLAAFVAELPRARRAA